MRILPTSIGIIFVAVALAPSALAQEGTVKEGQTLESNILDRSVKYSVYLPPGYNRSSRKYPVLYLLHGYLQDETAWIQSGEVKHIADREIQKRNVSPMIVITPDAGASWYVNSHDDSVRYEDFFVQELIPYIEKKYSVRKGKRFRAIAGLSMGGYGSLLLSMKHPDLFSSSASLSAGIYTNEEIKEMHHDHWNPQYEVPFNENLRGKQRLTEHYLSNSVLHIVKTGDTEKLKQVRYYIDCGDQDFLIQGNMKLHETMLEKEIPHEFRVRDGRHSWSYWRSGLPDILRFVSESFH